MVMFNSSIIGVISHLAELKERIATHVEVIPSGNGHSKIQITEYSGVKWFFVTFGDYSYFRLAFLSITTFYGRLLFKLVLVLGHSYFSY